MPLAPTDIIILGNIRAKHEYVVNVIPQDTQWANVEYVFQLNQLPHKVK